MGDDVAVDCEYGDEHRHEHKARNHEKQKSARFRSDGALLSFFACDARNVGFLRKCVVVYGTYSLARYGKRVAVARNRFDFHFARNDFFVDLNLLRKGRSAHARASQNVREHILGHYLTVLVKSLYGHFDAVDGFVKRIENANEQKFFVVFSRNDILIRKRKIGTSGIEYAFFDNAIFAHFRPPFAFLTLLFDPFP